MEASLVRVDVGVIVTIVVVVFGLVGRRRRCHPHH
jgi:hypothetical protein